jgi:hypothetical protein
MLTVGPTPNGPAIYLGNKVVYNYPDAVEVYDLLEVESWWEEEAILACIAMILVPQGN